MAKRTMDVNFVKPPYKEGGKPYWMKVGVAFEGKTGTISVKLDVPLLPGMDIVLTEQKERESSGQSFDDE